MANTEGVAGSSDAKDSPEKSKMANAENISDLKPVNVQVETPGRFNLEKLDRAQVVIFKAIWWTAGLLCLLTVLLTAFPWLRVKAGNVFRNMLVSLSNEVKEERAERKANEFISRLGYKHVPEQLRFVILKKDRRLEIRDGEKLLAMMKIALGRDPKTGKHIPGNKEQEGDYRTPEGLFYICFQNPVSKYHLFLGISYPNEEDAKRGLEKSLISAEEAEKIRNASATKKDRPPWKTALGGEVGIHGHGADGDWTAGCIAVSNEDMELIYGLAEIGTPVEIRP